MPRPSPQPVDGIVVEARQVSRVYGRGETAHRALVDVDMVVQWGEMVAIMGPSGCGKTTLLNCLSGLDRPTSGSVLLAGRELGSLREPGLTRHRARAAGFIFQNYNLIPVLSAAENVMLPLLTQGLRERDARVRAHEILEQLGLAGKTHRRPSELSGGEQQRVAVARALGPRPPVVFADEPTGNLDRDRSSEVMQMLTGANRDGQTLVVVTHDAEVARRCSRVVHMDNGRVVDGAMDGVAGASASAAGGAVGAADGELDGVAPGAVVRLPARSRSRKAPSRRKKAGAGKARGSGGSGAGR